MAGGITVSRHNRPAHVLNVVNGKILNLLGLEGGSLRPPRRPHIFSRQYYPPSKRH